VHVVQIVLIARIGMAKGHDMVMRCCLWVDAEEEALKEYVTVVGCWRGGGLC